MKRDANGLGVARLVSDRQVELAALRNLKEVQIRVGYKTLTVRGQCGFSAHLIPPSFLIAPLLPLTHITLIIIAYSFFFCVVQDL